MKGMPMVPTPQAGTAAHMRRQQSGGDDPRSTGDDRSAPSHYDPRAAGGAGMWQTAAYPGQGPHPGQGPPPGWPKAKV